MGFLEDLKQTGIAVAKKAMAASSKDEVLADALFTFISSKGGLMKNSTRKADLHLANFELGNRMLDVRVQRRGGRNSPRTRVGGVGINLAAGFMPTMCDITFKVYDKGTGFFSRIFSGQKQKFVMNVDEYIDDNLRVKDPAAFNAKLLEYLKSTGI